MNGASVTAVPCQRKQNRVKMFPDVHNNIAMPTLTKEIINAAILGFEEQRRRLDDQIAELRAMLPGSRVLTPKPRPTVSNNRRMSAAGREAIAEAQRKRWAASRSKSEPTALKAAKPKRKLSAAGRAAIVAALKKRWAAKKAGAKKAT